MKIFTGTSNPELFKKIIRELSNKIAITDYNTPELSIERFSDGEILPCFRQSIRDKDVYFINSIHTPELTMETLLVCDAAKRAGCKSLTLISPSICYSRQDKTDHHRSSIGAKLMADILQVAGITKLITVDLHSPSIVGFYNIPIDHLNGGQIFVPYVRSLNLENICIVSPDQGGVKRATKFGKYFPEASFAMINKKRTKPNEIDSMELVGNVQGTNVILVDDMSDTFGTVKKAADLLVASGAASVRAIATHGVLSGPAMKNLEDSKITELIVSDTLETTLVKAATNKKLKVVTCAELVANSIFAISQNRSLYDMGLV